MKTRILGITRQMPEWDVVNAAAQVIDRGGIACFPTDTVYGFAASIYCSRAIRRLRTLKRRGPHDPFVVIASDMDIVRELARSITPKHRQLMSLHWPGPLTIVFEASVRVPDDVTGPDGTVALRIPNDTLTQSILRACGTPLAAPSANLRGRQPAQAPDEVLARFDGKIDLLLDGGQIECPEPSTIVTLERRTLRVLRPGKVPVGRIRR